MTLIAQIDDGGKSYWVDGTISDQGGTLSTIDTPSYGSALIVRDETAALRVMRVADIFACGTNQSTDRLEKLSVTDALRAIRFSEVVVLVIDAERPFEKQDLQIADLIETEGRAIVIALDKWDLVDDRQKTFAMIREKVERAVAKVWEA